MKAKHLEKALIQFAEEGAAKVFKPIDRLGLDRRRRRAAAVRRAGQPDRAGIRPAGALRADAVHLRPLGLRADATEVEAFVKANKGHMAADHDGDPVYMTRLQWDIDRVVATIPA